MSYSYDRRVAFDPIKQQEKQLWDLWKRWSRKQRDRSRSEWMRRQVAEAAGDPEAMDRVLTKLRNVGAR